MLHGNISASGAIDEAEQRHRPLQVTHQGFQFDETMAGVPAERNVPVDNPDGLFASQRLNQSFPGKGTEHPYLDEAYFQPFITFFINDHPGGTGGALHSDEYYLGILGAVLFYLSAVTPAEMGGELPVYIVQLLFGSLESVTVL